MGFKYDRLPAHLKAAIDDQIARDRDAEQKRNELGTLDGKTQGPDCMVYLSGPLLVRIIRYCGRGERDYDDDNMSGGCKELRDSIAAALGRGGDSEKDGFTWEYEQRRSETGEPMTEIQIYKGA